MEGWSEALVHAFYTKVEKREEKTVLSVPPVLQPASIWFPSGSFSLGKNFPCYSDRERLGCGEKAVIRRPNDRDGYGR